MKIVIDNNVLMEKEIEKLKSANIFKFVNSGQYNFHASAQLLNQFLPFLIKKDNTEKKYYLDFLFDLTKNNRIFNNCAEISQKELAQRRGKIQYVPCALQKKMKKENFYNQNILSRAENYLRKPEDYNNILKNEMQKYTDKNLKLINELKSSSYDKIDENIKKVLKPNNYSDKEINAAINIVTCRNNEPNLSKDKKKKIIYESLFELLQEINLLAQLKEQKKLIKDDLFFKNYYKNYYKQSFTKTMIKTILFGYSYKVKYQNKGYDEDWANDGSYVSYTYFADLLLTNDTKYMKDMFREIYGNTKQIMTVNEFIDNYC